MVVSLECPKIFISYFVTSAFHPSDAKNRKKEKYSTTLYAAHESSRSSHLTSHQAVCDALKNKLIHHRQNCPNQNFPVCHKIK